MFKNKKLHHLSTRITIYYVLIFVLFIALLIVSISHIFSNHVKQEMNQLAKQQLGLVSTEISYDIASIRDLYFTTVHRQVLQDGMKRVFNGDELTLEEFIPISEDLTALTNDFSNIRSIILISSNDTILSPIYSVEPYRSWLLNYDEFKAFKKNPMSFNISSSNTFPILTKNYNPEKECNTLMAQGVFFENQSYKKLGTVIIPFTKSSIFSNVEKHLLPSFSAAYIFNEENKIVNTMGNLDTKRYNSKLTDLKNDTIVLDGITYAYYKSTISDYPQWTIVGLIAIEQLTAPLKTIYSSLIFIAIIIIIFLTGISIIVSRHETIPIKEIIKAMKKTGRGGWQKVKRGKTSIELENLSIEYNNMVDSLKDLTTQIQNERDEKQQIKFNMLQSKLELLQMQINPHFLHNTLNTMRYMAQKEGNKVLADTILSFNKLLRSSMSESKDLNTLNEEIELLHSYLYIQLKRFEADVAFVEYTTPETHNFPLPKLILQPIVENSLYHGLLPKGNGTIILNACIEEKRLWVRISDNGVGIPKEKLRKMLANEIPNTRGYSRVGLHNVSNRLKLYYGDTSQLIVESTENKGTTVSFSIPIDVFLNSSE